MRLGLYLNLYGDGDVDGAGGAADSGDGASSGGTATQFGYAVEQARLAEQAGFDWIVLGERHLYRPGYHEILTSLTWLAAHTDRIGIATAGIVAPLYQPVVLAETLAHLDVLSGGRLTAGFVLGYRPEEFALYGVTQAERVARFEECLTILTRLWTEDEVTFDGKYTSIHEAFLSPKPVQDPRPRLWNGGRVSAMLERTARMCDGWTTSFNELDADLPAKIAEYRSYPRGEDTLGAEVIVCREGFAAPTSQQARQSLEEPLRDLYDAYTGWKRTSTDASRYTQGWDDIAARSVIGSPAECTERLQHYEELGADGIILRIQPPGMPQAEVLKSIEAFGEIIN